MILIIILTLLIPFNFGNQVYKKFSANLDSILLENISESLNLDDQSFYQEIFIKRTNQDVKRYLELNRIITNTEIYYSFENNCCYTLIKYQFMGINYQISKGVGISEKNRI